MTNTAATEQIAATIAAMNTTKACKAALLAQALTDIHARFVLNGAVSSLSVADYLGIYAR